MMKNDTNPQDVRRVDHYLATLANEPTTQLPTVGQLRWRADILARLGAEEARRRRLTRPLRWAGAVMVALIVLGLAPWTAQIMVEGGDWTDTARTVLVAVAWLVPVSLGSWAMWSISRA